jgi:hypothetical protein
MQCKSSLWRLANYTIAASIATGLMAFLFLCGFLCGGILFVYKLIVNAGNDENGDETAGGATWTSRRSN